MNTHIAKIYCLTAHDLSYTFDEKFLSDVPVGALKRLIGECVFFNLPISKNDVKIQWSRVKRENGYVSKAREGESYFEEILESHMINHDTEWVRDMFAKVGLTDQPFYSPTQMRALRQEWGLTEIQTELSLG